MLPGTIVQTREGSLLWALVAFSATWLGFVRIREGCSCCGVLRAGASVLSGEDKAWGWTAATQPRVVSGPQSDSGQGRRGPQVPRPYKGEGGDIGVTWWVGLGQWEGFTAMLSAGAQKSLRVCRGTQNCVFKASRADVEQIHWGVFVHS